MKKCTLCNIQNPDDAVFCRKCGLALPNRTNVGQKDNSKRLNNMRVPAKILWTIVVIVVVVALLSSGCGMAETIIFILGALCILAYIW